jgi:DNA repair protein RadC
MSKIHGAFSTVPVSQRPRERLLRLGPEALTDHELLALVLRAGVRGHHVLDLAESLIIENAGLANLFRARPEELARQSGIGVAKAASVVAAFHLGLRAAAAPASGSILRRPSDLASVARPAFAGLRRERAVVIVCNGANRVVVAVKISEGSADRSMLPVREILNAVLRHDGRAFGLAHNHPGGDPSPSDADREATAEVAAGARAVGLRFLGHVIVGGGAQWAAVEPATNPRTPR